MEKKNIEKILVAVLVGLLVFSSYVFLFGSQPTGAKAQTTYGDIMQYDWPQQGRDEGCSGYNPGPAPNRANVLWSASETGSGQVSVFNGKAFLIQGAIIGGATGASVIAFDAFTGQKVWTANVPLPFKGVSGVQKLDNTYLLGYDVGFMTAVRIADGSVAWSLNITGGSGLPGTGSYFAGHYSDTLKVFATSSWDQTTNQAKFVGYDLSNPSQAPPIIWTYLCTTPSEMLCSGDGKFYLGTTEATVVAINGRTGQLEWESATRGGLVQQSAMYQDGNLYTSAVSWQLTCFDSATGQIKWQTEKGTRAFSAYRGAVGFGMVFDATVELDPHGTIRAWDAETGAEIWRQSAYFNIHYATMAVADGKLYAMTCDQSATSQTGGLQMPGYETACFDIYTGTQLWKLKGIGMSHVTIAYGNLYGFYGNRLYCIGGEPKDWTLGLEGDVNTGRAAIGQQGPNDISTPKWTFQTGGDVSSSPAVVKGKVYVGSHDKNWYCLDAYTGAKIWNFTIGWFVRSSAAVAGGRLYTGADDGYFYCLDANTGAQIWKTSAGGHFPNLFTAIEYQSRSSPIVVGDKVYVGSLDGKVYCLNTANGNVISTYNTGSPIFGSPTHYSGTIYIASTDFYLYALNTESLSLKWKSISLQMDIDVDSVGRSKFSMDGTPAIGNGVIYMQAGVYSGVPRPGANYTGQSVPRIGGYGGAMRMMAFNATTGASIWNQTRSGNTPIHVPTYFNGQIYGPEFFYVTSMSVSKPNSGTAALGDFGGSSSTPRLSGNRTWAQWLGYQITSSAAYADDPTGAKTYIGSDIGSLYAIEASTGKTLSVFTAGANIPSSPAVWDGKLYACAVNGKVYCFDDSPKVDFSINAASSKGSAMWASQTVTIGGRLTSNPIDQVWTDDTFYLPTPSTQHPGLPNATVIVSFTKPDGTSFNVTKTTDKNGDFTADYTPTEIGNWGWVAFYEGKVANGLTYNPTFTQFSALSVTAGPVQTTSTPEVTANPTATPEVTATPIETATPIVTATPAPVDNTMTYALIGIAVIVIVAIIAVAALMLRKKK
jgi:outer membrane protein assembly factor BamB